MNDWNNMLQQTRAAIETYKLVANSLDSVMLGQCYVVRCQALPLAFDVDADLVTNPRPSPPQLATRFSLDDAARVAALVKNGNGEVGEVVHVRHAIVEAMAAQRELLAILEENSNTTSV